MRVHRHGRFAERRVQHHVGGLAAHARQCFQRLAVARHVATVQVHQHAAGGHHILALVLVQADGLDIRLEFFLAQVENGLRRVGHRVQLARGLVDAHVGRLRRQQHGDQQFEGRRVFQFGLGVGIGGAEAHEHFVAFGWIHSGWGPLLLAAFSAGTAGSSACGVRRIERDHGIHLGGGLGGQAGVVLLLVALQARRAAVVALARGVGLGLTPRGPARRFRDRVHDDAVDRARMDAQVAAGAQIGHHGVHQLGGTHDGVHRARLDAQRAADAQAFVDIRHGARPLQAVDGIERDDPAAGNGGEPHDAFGAARRALVDVGRAAGNGFGIRAAAVIAALGALRLRQDVFDAVGEAGDGGVGHGSFNCGKTPLSDIWEGTARNPERNTAKSARWRVPPGAPMMVKRRRRVPARRSGVLLDELGNFRAHQLAPATARKNAVVAGAGRHEIEVHGGGNAGAQVVRGLGLAGAGNVVEFTLDREQRHGGDVLRAHQLAAHFPHAARQGEFLEHGLDRVQVIFSRHVQHGVVFVVELAVRFGRFFVALDQVIVKVAVAFGVPARVHGNEAGVLQEARIHLASEAGVIGRHRIDHGVFEPREFFLGGQVVDGRGRAARVDRAAHHGHGFGQLGIVGGGHQGNRGQHRHRGLAYGNHVHVRAQQANKILHIINVVVEVEGAVGERHHARVGPVGDVHVVLDQQAAYGVAQQRGVVARQRRHQQHGGLRQGLGLLVVQVFLEMDQAAERLVDHHALDDAHRLVVGRALDGRRVDVERRLFIILAQSVHQFVTGRDALRKRRVRQRRHGVAEHFGGGVGPLHQGREQRALHFVQLVEHSESRSCFVEDWRFHAQHLVQLGRRGRVLHVDLLVRENVRRGAKGSQGCFVEARQDQLFLARIGVDVADGKDARHIGFELLRVLHLELAALDVQAPLGDRAQLWRQAVEHQQHVQRHAARHAVLAGHLQFGQLVILGFETGGLAHDQLHFVVVAQRFHLGDRRRRRAEVFAAVQQHDRFGLADEVQRPVQRGVAAAADDQVLAFELGRILDLVVQLRAFEHVDAVDLQRAGLERTDAGGNEDGLGDELGAGRGGDIEAAVVAAGDLDHFLAQVERRFERFDLLEQVVGQFLAGARWHGRDVVDRLVGIQFDALSAHRAQRIDHVGFDFQQAQFEDLEQADRAGANDDGIGFDDADGSVLAYQQVQLVFDVLELVRFRQRGDRLGDRRPVARQVGIELDVLLLVARDVFLGINRIDRALGHAHGAVDALVRVDGKEVRSRAETIYRANIDAVRITAADARFGDNVSHNSPINVGAQWFRQRRERFAEFAAQPGAAAYRAWFSDQRVCIADREQGGRQDAPRVYRLSTASQGKPARGAGRAALFQVFDQVDVLLLGVVGAGAFQAIPRVELGAADHVGKAGTLAGGVACRRLLVQRVDFQQGHIVRTFRQRDAYLAFLAGLTADFRVAPAENFGVFDAAILIASPVAGLRPLRAARLATEKVPKPVMPTVSPFFRRSVTMAIRVFTAVLAAAADISDDELFRRDTDGLRRWRTGRRYASRHRRRHAPRRPPGAPRGPPARRARRRVRRPGAHPRAGPGQGGAAGGHPRPARRRAAGCAQGAQAALDLARVERDRAGGRDRFAGRALCARVLAAHLAGRAAARAHHRHQPQRHAGRARQARYRAERTNGRRRAIGRRHAGGLELSVERGGILPHLHPGGPEPGPGGHGVPRQRGVARAGAGAKHAPGAADGFAAGRAAHGRHRNADRRAGSDRPAHRGRHDGCQGGAGGVAQELAALGEGRKNCLLSSRHPRVREDDDSTFCGRNLER
uniref:Uncharacterized protein n=1 Tax=Tanacetum cinerariifolium TaxID=118510 RepID=A0A699GDK0_TANCI|nr:hypothetical protein [Tanacetum cinerariifolium]